MRRRKNVGWWLVNSFWQSDGDIFLFLSEGRQWIRTLDRHKHTNTHTLLKGSVKKERSNEVCTRFTVPPRTEEWRGTEKAPDGQRNGVLITHIIVVEHTGQKKQGFVWVHEIVSCPRRVGKTILVLCCVKNTQF